MRRACGDSCRAARALNSEAGRSADRPVHRPDTRRGTPPRRPDAQGPRPSATPPGDRPPRRPDPPRTRRPRVREGRRGPVLLRARRCTAAAPARSRPRARRSAWGSKQSHAVAAGGDQPGEQPALHAPAEDRAPRGRRPDSQREEPCARRTRAARPPPPSAGARPGGSGCVLRDHDRRRNAQALGERAREIGDPAAEVGAAGPALRGTRGTGGVRHDDGVTKAGPLDTPLPTSDTTPTSSCPRGAGRGPRAGVGAGTHHLGVGRAGQRDQDVDHDLPGPGDGFGHVLEPEIAGAVQDQRSHTATVHRLAPPGGSIPGPPVTEAAHALSRAPARHGRGVTSRASPSRRPTPTSFGRWRARRD